MSKDKMEELTMFRDFVGDSPSTRLLEFLIQGRELDYTLTEISEKAGVSWTTLNRLWPSIIKNKIVKVTREIGKIKLYRLNLDNKGVKKLVELFDYLLFKDIDNRINVEKISA